MAASGEPMSLLTQPQTGPGPGPAAPDQPREIDAGRPPVDRLFHGSARTVGGLVLVLIGSIGVFLGLQSIPTLRHYGWSFFTQSSWEPAFDKIGISAVLLGTFEVALVAMVFAFPLALATAIYISDYAPARAKSSLVALVDLMAAVPSIVWGLWGFFLLEPRAIYVARWLNTYLGWLPFFHVDTDPRAAVWSQTRYTASAFIAGMAVAMMVLPMACAVMRGVFDQAPIGEREAALALGGTRWGVVRSVVLPFGRGGIVGGTMLALGRALGETISVVLIISPAFDIKFRPLEVGTETISALIAGRFGEATTSQLSALLTAGFVLFLITLVTNTVAATVVNRSRNGAATEI
jgi:phosphate transport system permease protein